MRHFAAMASLVVLLAGSAAAAEPASILESARQIPVAYQVDVVVVGGSTGAVAAAVAAAKQGAKVFLAAPYPYLGDDMTATLRLWLEPGEVPSSPLAKAIYADPGAAVPRPNANRLRFQYETEPKSSARHKDTTPPSRLNDGAWGDSTKQSVQYDTDVRITADLAKVQEIAEARVIAYRRDSGPGGFDVAGVTVQASDDQRTWKEVAKVENDRKNMEYAVLSAAIGGKARYLRFLVKRPAGVERILLGQIEILGPERKPASAPVVRQLPPPRPMHVKQVLDQALLDAGVPFLYQCYATDLLRDSKGLPCGIVMANRAGRQAVVAKMIIDATDRARVTRMTLPFEPYSAGIHEFRRVVVGGEVRKAEGMTARTIDPPFTGPFPNRAKTPSGLFPIIEYTLKIPMQGDTPGDWAAAEQRARDLTYHPVQQFTSDALFEVPPDRFLRSVGSDEGWQGVDRLTLEAFHPWPLPTIYILGGCADVSPTVAAKLLRPLALIELGQRIGAAAAEEAKYLATPRGVKVHGGPRIHHAPRDGDPHAEREEYGKEYDAGEVRETLVGVRPTQKLPTIPQEARPLPVFGRYDVVVVGGGTSGAPAGIAAARQGAKTLVLESLHGLGGVGTVGAISNYYHGNRVGFTATVGGGNTWIIEQKMEWWRSTLRQAGAEIWMGAIGCGVIVRNQQVVGVVVATPQGRGAVLAKVVVDATGNADVAAAAGAACRYTGAGELAVQGTGLPPRQLGASYTNTDFTITDETDLVDVWHMLVYAKHKYPDAFDQGQLVDTRERRSVVGDFTETVLDQLNARTYPDTISQARGGKYDTHGYTVDPFLVVAHPTSTTALIVDVPYRCLLAKGLEGLLVTGLGMSAQRDAQPLLRMQPDMQNLGYATGTAAAMAAKAGTLVRNIDVRELQKHLVKIGNLSPAVLKDQDSYPLPAERLAAAVAGVATDRVAAAPLFAQPEQSLPLLRAAYVRAAGKDKLSYALMLGMLGDAAGVETLLAEVRGAAKWDAGWNYKGMGQYGNALSPLDAALVALGRTRDRRAVPIVLEKLRTLSAEEAFSHHRAVGLALESLGDPAAAKPLAELLARPGMSGHVQATMEVAMRQETPGGTNNEQTRRDSIREILLARALLRCGDYQGQGRRILESYTHDLRGHLARHAQAVLAEAK